MFSHSLKKFGDWVKKRTRKITFGMYFVVTIIVFAILILVSDRNSVFSVNGETQSLSIAMTNNEINQWVFHHGMLFSPWQLDNSIELDDEQTFTLEAGTKVTATVSQQADVAVAILTFRNEQGAVGTLENGNEKLILNDYAELTLNSATSATFPFDGQAFIGEDVGKDVSSLLLNGEVRILEKQLMSSKRYLGDVYQLNMGDRVYIESGDMAVISKGFFRFPVNDAIYFSITSEGDQVNVERFGSSRLTLTPSFWSRMISDPFVAALTSTLALIFLLMEFALVFIQIIRKDPA